MKHHYFTPIINRVSILINRVSILRLPVGIVCGLLFGIVFTGCGREKSGSGRTVTVTLPPEAWLAQEVVGDRMKVNTLLPVGANPETYDPTVGDIRRLASSDLLLVSGTLQFEDKITSQLRDEMKIADLSKGIDLLYDTHSHNDGNHHHPAKHPSPDEAHGHGSGADPHVWSSVGNAKIIVDNILTALVNADPEGKEQYEANAARLNERLDSLSSAFTRRLSPLKGSSFLIWHPSLSYLARDYGLRQQFLEMENKEQSVKSFKALVDSLDNSRPLVMFVQPEYDTPTAAAMAREFSLPSVSINPLNPNWMEEMERVVNALAPQN